MEKMYPDKKARDAADEAVDHLSNDEPMTRFIILWEEIYLANGGRVIL